MMNLKVRILFLIIVSSVLLCSCLNDSEESDVEITNNCAITDMVLGTLKRTVTTKKSSGEDTTYVTTISGNLYPMHIDQYKGEIYNVDSLPLGTDIKKIVFSSVSSDGTVGYRLTSGNDTLYSLSDSLDFTNPQIFTCYAYSGKAKKTYTVRVNVRKVDPDHFVWNCVAENAEFAALERLKLLRRHSDLFLFAEKEGNKSVFLSSTNSAEAWKVQSLRGDVPDDVSQIVCYKEAFYATKNGALVLSVDGILWSIASSAHFFDFVIGCSSNLLFVKSPDGLLNTSDFLTWTFDELDSSVDLLPNTDCSFVCTPMNFNTNFEYVLWAGRTADGQNVLWKNTLDITGVNRDKWSYYPFTEEVTYPHPEVKSPVMFNYDNCTLYLGCENDTLSLFYSSKDAGRTWKPEKDVYVHPYALRADRVTALVDDENYIWIVCSGSGQVWRGRINRLAVVNP